MIYNDLLFLHPYLDSFGWRPLSAGASGEVQAGLCLWPGAVIIGEADGRPSLLQEGVGIQP